MKNHLFARCLRASGRLLLFVGAVFDLGLITLFIFAIIYSMQHSGAPLSAVFQTPEHRQATTNAIAEANLHPALAITISIAAVLITLALVITVACIYNRHMRRMIQRIAKLFRASIFNTEIISTLVVWTIATVILLFIYPVISIVAIFTFVTNLLCFTLAWGAYGQPKYKL